MQAQLLENAKKAKGSSSSASKTVPIDKTKDASGGINDVQNLLNLWYTGKPSTNPLTIPAVRPVAVIDQPKTIQGIIQSLKEKDNRRTDAGYRKTDSADQ